MKKISTKTIVMTGMFTAVLSILSIMTIPLPSGVPVTLQTFAMALCGYILGCKKGTSSALLYVALGIIGIPVFAGMKGGPSCLAGYTGGFIFGFIFLTLICGLSIDITKTKKWFHIFLGLFGLTICHLLGVIHFSIVASVSIKIAFLTVSVPYILKDIISVIAAYLISIPIRNALLISNIIGDKMDD